MPAPIGPVRTSGAHQVTVAALTNVFDMPANPDAGNAVVLLIAANSNALATPSVAGCGATWTRLAGPITPGNPLSFGDHVPTLWIFLGINCSGAAKTITVTFAAAVRSTVNGSEWSNVSATSADSNAGESGGQGAQVLPSIVPTFANTLCVAIATARQPTTGGPDVTSIATGTANGWIALPSMDQAGAYHVQASYKLVTGSTAAQSTSFPVVSPGGVEPAWLAVALRGNPLPAAYGTATFSELATGYAVGTGAAVGPLVLEARVYDGDDPMGPALAILDGASALRLLDVFNAVGSFGSLALPLANVKATAALLAVGNVVRFFIGPFDVFDWIIETPLYAVGAPEGDAGETVVLQGGQIEVYMERGEVLTTTAFASATAGVILRSLITAAQARGALPLLAVDFSAASDSAGVAWVSPLTLTFNAGTDLLAVITQLRGQGIVIRMRSDFTLQAWQTYGRHLEGTVMLREGRHLAGVVSWTRPNERPVSVLVVEGSGGTTATYADPAPPFADRREGYFKGPDTTDGATLILAGQAEVRRRNQAAAAISVPIHHGMDPGQVEPYHHFGPGDYIGLDVPGRFDRASEQVAGITIESADAGGYAVTLSLSALQPDPTRRLIEAVRALQRP